MFDIDKFFLSRLYINSNGSTEFKEGTHEWHANRLINAYLAVLKDSHNSFQDLNGSIDNDTSLLTDVRDDLREGQKSKTLLPYSAYTLRSQSATKNVFIAGKFGIGPFALNNNMHILMQLYGVKFAEEENIMSDLGLTKLGGFTDRYGRSILSWFSGLINAHVDSAKDPWIPELNVNKYTYNLVSVLMHSGLGKDTFYFTTQPIMRQLATAYENASGVYMSDQSKSKSKVQQEAEEEVIKNMIDAHWDKQLLEDGVATEQTFSFSSYNAAVKAYCKTKGYTPQDAIKALFEKDCQVMRQIAKKHIGEPGSQFLSVEDDQTSYRLTINGQEYNLSAFDVQMIVVAANSQLKPYAKALSKLVQHTKIDTKKQGKNLIEQRKYLQGVSDLFDSTQMSDDRLLFDTETLDRLYTDSYIQHQTKLATDLFRQIMANQMIEATDKFVTDVDRVLKTIGNPGTDPKVLNAVQNGIMAKIKSKFFFGQDGYCERHKINPRSLVAGKNTIYDKLLTIKAMLVNDPKYKDLLDRRSGEPSNYLLRALVSGNKYRRFDENVSYSIGTSPDTFMDAKFIQTLGFVTDESFNADDFSQAWDDLLQDSKYPELQQFARELIVYAFITSGDNGGNYDLFKYVPNTWRLGQTEEGVSYADHMAQQHTKYIDGVDVLDENDFEDVILNMWQDDNIVPKYSMYRKNFKIFESWDTDKSAAGLPVVIGAVDKKGKPTISRDKAYIKVPRFNNGVEVKGQRGYVVYKRIGYGTSKANQLYPIYAMIDPRGEVFDKNERIFQHWQEDYSETGNIVEKYLGQILKAAELQATTVEDAVTKIADYILANKLDLQTIVEGGLLNENLSYIIKDINRTSSTVAQNDQPLPVQTVNFYEGLIVPDGNTVFVFGSNPGGVHGAGAAKTARDMFGAQTGVGEGMTGNAYALPTKDLEASKGTEWYKPGEEQRDKILQYYKQQQNGVMFDPSNISYQEVVDNPIKRTIVPEKIVESIKRMYEVARQNPEKQFKVAYGNGLTEITYNGYIGAEMIEMFKEAGPIPSNVLFNRAWVSSGMFDQTIKEPEVKAPGTYDMPQQGYINHSGGAVGSDSYWGEIGEQYSVTSNHYYHGQGTPEGNKEISQQDYEEGRFESAKAAKRNWGYQYSTMKDDRLIRNWAQVKYADAIFAIGHIVQPGEKAFQNQRNDTRTAISPMVTGGTGYAVGMAILHNKPVYVFDQQDGKWYRWDTSANNFVESDTPTLTKNFAGIGTRELNEVGKQAIRDVYEKTFGKKQSSPQQPAEQNGVQEERKPRLIKKGRTDYENVYQNMTDSEYEEWKKNQGIGQETHKMQAVGRNPYKIQLESKQIILSTDVSDSFDKYLQKSRNNYPKEFYDNEKRVKYVKSNNHKHSRLYDIVDIETGEIIAQKLPLFTKDQWERQQESRKKLDEQFTNYNQSRSFAFKKSISTPSKGLFKKMAKQYLLEAIRAQSDVSESVINHKIIDDFVDQFNDTVWEHVITYALDPTHGPGREDSAYDSRLFGMATTDPRELLRFAFNPTIPKQGLIDEVCKALNLDKNTLTFTGYAKGEYYKKQKISRNLPYDVLQEMLEQIVESEDKRVEMDLIQAYSESTGETVQQVQDRINQLRQEGTIEASKEIQRILHGTSATNIVLRIQKNYSKQYKQWLDEKGIVVPNNIVRIIFNRHSFAADDTPIVRLATIMHEPFHALEMLHHGTEALDKVQHAFDVFLQTEYGKQIFEDYKKHNNEITGYKEGDLQSEFLADLFSLMMMPPQLRAQYTAAEDRILGARLAKTLNDLLNSPDFKTIMTVEPKAVIESFTEQQRIILPLLKQIYNAIIKWLSEYSTFVKNTFKLYDEFVTVTSYRRNDTFEKVEQVNKLGVSFEEALNTLFEAMARLSLEDVDAGQNVPASTMFMQSNQYSDYIESQAYLDNLKSLGEEQERKCKGE